VLLLSALHLALALLIPELYLMLVRPSPALEPVAKSPADHTGQGKSHDQKQ
jgi:hypothetical protein